MHGSFLSSGTTHMVQTGFQEPTVETQINHLEHSIWIWSTLFATNPLVFKRLQADEQTCLSMVMELSQTV